MFGPTTFILSFINRLPSGQIFTTRDLLHTAWRAAVDKALSRLVAKEYIIRLSRGVFIRNDYKVIMPSIEKIAHVKAESFGKHILSHGADAAQQLGLTDTGNKELTFYTTCYAQRISARVERNISAGWKDRSHENRLQVYSRITVETMA